MSLCAEVLGSMKCDCAEQLELALAYIRNNSPGVVIYLQQEGRGIGLANKIAAYALQVRPVASLSHNLPTDACCVGPCCETEGHLLCRSKALTQWTQIVNWACPMTLASIRLCATFCLISTSKVFA